MIEGLTLNLVFAVISVALAAGFQHGYHTGVLNNPVILLEKYVNNCLQERDLDHSKGMINFLYSLCVAFYMIGGMIGGALISVISSRWGRKRGLYYTSFLVVLAGPLMTISSFTSLIELLMVGRVVIGIMCGINAGLATMYLSEVSPVHLRGSMSSFYQLNIIVGILFSQVMSIRELLGTQEDWKFLFLIPVFCMIFTSLMLYYCPESPKYLLKVRGEENIYEAKKALAWLRHKSEDDVRPEVLRLIQLNELQRQESKVSVTDLFSRQAFRQPLVISMVLIVGQQFSGYNIWVFNSHKIFVETMGMSDAMASVMTIVLSAVSLAMTVASLLVVDIAGRKTLLMVSFVGLAASCLALTMFQSTKGLVNPTFMHFGLNTSVLAFISFYSIGAGPIPWFLVSELFDQSSRSTATMVAVLFSWFCNALVGLIFPLMIISLSHFVYMVFFIMNAVFASFVWIQVPETMNVAAEEIASTFNDDPRNAILRSSRIPHDNTLDLLGR